MTTTMMKQTQPTTVLELDRGSFAHSPTPAETIDPSKPSPLDLKVFLPWACRQLQAPDEVVVTTVHQVQYVSIVEHKTKRKKSRIGGGAPEKAVSAYSAPVVEPAASSGESVRSADAGKIRLTAVLNSQERCVQIKLLNNRHVPRMLLKVLSLVLKFHAQLATFTINSGLDMYALHELSHLIPLSNFTEVCLDGAGRAGLNYSVLLAHESHLTHLSLARCKVDDKAAYEIAEALTPPEPASSKLAILNLTSNRITDAGARYLADMLRTNRTLHYLNISDNKITDCGAAAIFEVLREFEVTRDELNAYKDRFGHYLHAKLGVLNKLRERLKETVPPPPKAKQKRGSRYGLSVDQTAESLVSNYIGRFDDPYNPRNTVRHSGRVFCKGNNSLAYLNLAYLSMSLVSLRRLLATVGYQKARAELPRGLVAVCLEGNPLPRDCDEFALLELLLGVEAGSQKSIKIKRSRH